MTICNKCGADNVNNDTGYCKFCLAALIDEAVEKSDINISQNTANDQQVKSQSSSGQDRYGSIMVQTKKKPVINDIPAQPAKTDLNQDANSPLISSSNNADEPLFEIKEVDFGSSSIPGYVAADSQGSGAFREEDFLKEPSVNDDIPGTDDIVKEPMINTDTDNIDINIEQEESGASITFEDDADFMSTPEIPIQEPPELYESSQDDQYELDKTEQEMNDTPMTQRIVINPQLIKNAQPSAETPTGQIPTRKRREPVIEEFAPKREVSGSIASQHHETKIDEQLMAKVSEAPKPTHAQKVAFLEGNAIKFAGGYKPNQGDHLILNENEFILKEKPVSKISQIPLWAWISGGVLAFLIIITTLVISMGVTDYGQVAGILIDPVSGRAISKGTVTIKELDRTVQTSYAGFFVFDDIPPGIYTVVLEEDGVGIVSERLSVLEDKTSTLKLSWPSESSGTMDNNASNIPVQTSAETEEEAASQPGFMKLSLTPGDAQIFLDGKYLGKGSQTFKVASGKHKVAIKSAGYSDKSITVQIPEDQTKSYSVTLDKASAKGGNKTDSEMAAELEASGSYTEALGYYEKLLLKDKTNPQAVLGKARCLQAKGSIEEALASYLEAAKFSGNRNDVQSELAALDGVISINPKYLTAVYQRGMIYFNRGDFPKAAEDFSNVVGIDKRNLNGYYKLGESYYKAGNYAAAIEAYKQAQALNFADVMPYVYITKSYIKLDDKKNAKKYYDKFEKEADGSIKNKIRSDSEWQQIRIMLD